MDNVKRQRNWKRAFLAAFGKTGVVSYACQAAGICRGTYYQARERDPKFATACEVAWKESTDTLELIAMKRATAMEGPSDTLLIFLLKSRDPARFRDYHSIEHTGRNGGPIKTEVSEIDISKCSVEDLKVLERVVGNAPAQSASNPQTTG